MARTLLISAMAVFLLQTVAVAGPIDTQHAGQAPAAAASDSAYVLGAADKIRIVVYEEEALSGQFSVAANGDVAYPLVGPVKAAGLTPEQLGVTIAGLLNNGYIKDPRVSVEVLSSRPYYILGEVAKPGEYPFSSDLTVMKAVAAAGGFSYRANRRRVFIKRMHDDNEHAEALTPSTKLAPGDTIRIIERFY
jgi:protein involved in polysaccharide export with SLBB domain